MANIAQPQVVINYISQLKKITVNRVNQPSQLIIQTDYNLNETYNFQVINKINQIVELDVNTTYQLYGTYIDNKKTVHVLFYTLGVTPRDNMLSFLVNTYTSEYLAYVKNNRTPIDISIVAKQNVGGSTKSYMVLRDCALANPRGYIEGQAPTDIVYQNVFNSQIPVSTAFGAGNNINLAQDLDEQQIYSFAFGDTLSTNNANQFVIGYNNTPDATKAFIVANSGNIFTVDYQGNVEAGNINVGAISATSITVSGEDINSLVDEKVEYLSTAVDGKLEATSGWVNETFEPISTAQQNFNILTGQTSYLSGQIDDQTTAIGELNTAIGSKANQTDLEALSGQVEAIHIPSAVSELENDVPYLSSIPTSYVQRTELTAYATSGWVDQNYAKKGEAPTDVYTKTEVDEISSALSSAVSGAGYLTEIPTSYVQQDAISDMATQTWVGEQGFASASDIPTVGDLSAGMYSAISGDVEAQITGKNYITSEALNGLATQDYVTGQIAPVQTEVDGLSGLVSAILEAEVVTPQEAEQMIADATSAMATTGWVTGQGYLTEVPTSYVQQSQLEDYAQLSDIPVVPTYVQGDNVSITSTGLNEYTISATDTTYTAGNGLALENGEFRLTAAVGGNYEAGEGLKLEGNEFSLTGTVLSGSEHISVANNVISLIGDVGKTYTGASGIIVDDTVIGISANFLSANALEGYATQSWVGQQGFALTSQLPTDYTTSAQVSSIVEGYDFATEAEIPTTVAELTDASDYALKSELPSDYTTSAQVSSIVEGYDFATESFVTGQGYITDADLTDYAQLSDIPTTVSELTNDSNYISAITLSAYNASTMQNEAVQTTTIDLASTDFVTWNGKVYINDNKFDIPTDAEISGIASAVASTYVEGSTISAVSQLINDVGFVTEPRVSAIASAYAQGGGGTTYTAGSGITIDNGTIKTNLVAGSNVTFSVNDNAVTINATGGGGGGGSSDLSDYNNDVPFITAEDITNKQRVNTVNGSTITFDQAYEIFKTTYTGGDVTLNAVTVTTSQVGNGEVATFEEWITFSSSVTSLSEGTNTLVGEWPSSFDNTKTHVIVRRLYNNNGTITQYVSYAYNF